MHEFSHHLAYAVKHARNKMELTQEQVGEMIDADTRTISSIENGRSNTRICCFTADQADIYSLRLGSIHFDYIHSDILCGNADIHTHDNNDQYNDSELLKYFHIPVLSHLDDIQYPQRD